MGITGGVAAHYLPELIAQLRIRHMAVVYGVMTPAAAHFVSPLTLATATGTPVVTGIFEAAQRDPLAHIHLARLADLVLVAPATYDFIGRHASGLADDPVTLLLAATNAPGLLVPPVEGLQATGDVGEGRMADISKIISGLSGFAQTISQDQEE